VTRSKSRIDRAMNQVEPIASIQSIYRYPVKSMGGEGVERCDLTESGVFGDRLYAFESAGAPSGMLRLTSRERREMLRYRPTLCPDGRVEVRVPTGERFLVDSPAMLTYLTAHLPDANKLILTRAATPQTDVRPLSVISVQTVRQLSIEMGQEIDPRRFRANLYIDFPGPHSVRTALSVGRSASGRPQPFASGNVTRAADSLRTIPPNLCWLLFFL
jgi:uncharacterized protein